LALKGVMDAGARLPCAFVTGTGLIGRVRF
jgi:hypothetical protein